MDWVERGMWFTIAAFIVFGIWSVFRVNAIDDKCDKLGGVYVAGKYGSVCIQKSAVINLKAGK